MLQVRAGHKQVNGCSVAQDDEAPANVRRAQRASYRTLHERGRPGALDQVQQM